MDVKAAVRSCFIAVAFLFASQFFALVSPAQQGIQRLNRHVPRAIAEGKAEFISSMPAKQTIDMTFVLPLRNQAELTGLLADLYDPSSPKYRHFLSVDEFTAEFGPTQEDYQKLIEWSRSHGFKVKREAENRLILDVQGSVAQVNAALDVSMNNYSDPIKKRTFYSADREPTVDLDVSIAHIQGLNNYSVPQPMHKLTKNAQPVADVTGSGPGGYYLGSDMRVVYYGGATLTGAGQCVGLFQFGGYRLSDVSLTFANAGQTYSVPINNVLVNGATAAAGSDDSEEVLDIVQAIGLAPGLSQVRVYIGPSGSDASIFNTMATENVCKQLSVSWAWAPDDPGTDDSIFQEFAAQGQSIFVASGDYGAYDAAVSPYFYPAEDAYVTAVGGTHLTTNYGNGPWIAESAWNNPPYGSGGGTSPDGTAFPSWQQGVPTYSNGGSPYVRNVPDVAMEADLDNYYCAMGACSGGAGGTSFAAPRWAGFMALVNQQATEAGTAPTGGVGFLNPTIYSIGAGTNYITDFHDITSGNNDSDSQPVWYNAVTGYDLVTGWGSPNGQNFINALAGTLVAGFWLSDSPASLSVAQGSSATTTVSVTAAGGFSGSVSLAASGIPTGVTASFSPSATTGTSVLTLTASSSATLGAATITITGTSGSLTSKTAFFLTVNSAPATAPPVGAFSSVNVGASSSATTETLTFTTAGTLGSISVLTKGVANLDFTNAGGGTCTTGTVYAANATCTVKVTFSPKYAGMRYGAVVLADASGNTLAKMYLDGTGVGPQATFSPGTQTSIGSGFIAQEAAATLGDGSVYVTDYGSGAGVLYLEKFANGAYSQSNTNCTLKSPTGVAVDGSGTIYVADPGVPAVYKISLATGSCVETSIGSGFGAPWGIAVDASGDVYVGDVGTSSISPAIYKETLQASGSYVQSTVGTGWVAPWALAVDLNGNLDVADYSIPGVFMETASGGSYNQTPIGGGWTAPSGIAIDGGGNIYVSDAGSNVYGGLQVPSTIYKEVASGGSYNQSAIASGWAVPRGIAVDASGNLYVPDQTRGVFKLDLADPPTIGFANAVGGAISSDSPKTVTVSNIGVANLQFASLAYPSDFPEASGVSSDCTGMTSLAAQANCTLSIEFLPTTVLGSNTSLALNESVNLTTNSLNTSTQRGIAVSGTEVLATGGVTLSVSSNPTATGTPLTFTTTVTGRNGAPTPTGTVTLYSGSTSIAGPLTLSSGVATYTTSSLTVGTYSISASYSGDANFQSSTSNAVAESIVAVPGTAGFGNTSIGAQNIGSMSSTFPLTITFSTSETLGSISVLTEGAANLDFANAGGGTCSVGTAYAANASCTVNVTFTPRYSGARYGAVVLSDNNGNVIGTGYLKGTGVGPQTVFLPGMLTSIGSGFSYPQGTAVDGAGNVYVADVSNAAVYKETLANGTYTQSTIGSGLSQPYAVAVDGAGNIYIADAGTHSVYEEIPVNGTYSQIVVGSGFTSPQGVAVDAVGNVYVADFGNGVTPGATYLETPLNGTYTQSMIGSGFVTPQGVAVDGVGNVYVADSANGNGSPAVYKLTSVNGTYSQATIGAGWVTPSGVAVDGNGNLFVTDDAYGLGDGFVAKEALQPDGSYVQSTILSSEDTPYPGGVAVDGKGNLYVSDNFDGALYRDDIADPPAMSFATTTFGSTSSDSPKTISVENAGNAALTFSALSYPADFPEAPGVPGDCTSSTSLGAGAACTLSINFKPASLNGTNQSRLLSENASITSNSLNAGATTQNVAVAGTEAAPTAVVTLTVPANVASVGTSVTFTATMTGQNGITAPTGSVTFYANGATLGTMPLTSGIGAYTTNSLAVGQYSITAAYSGDQNYGAALSGAIIEQIIPASTFGTVNVGTTNTATITVTFTSKITLGSISVVTTGMQNLDFTNGGGGTCTTGKAYAAASTCTVIVAFNPRYSGTRHGAIVLGDSKGSLIQTIYLQGTGVGPQVGFALNNQIQIKPSVLSLQSVNDFTVDDYGNVYTLSANSGTSSVTKWTLSGGSYTSSTVPTSALTNPGHIAVDASGAVYITDGYFGSKQYDCRLLKEAPVAGVYKETVVKSGQLCQFPGNIAVDGSGNLYVVDNYNYRVLKETLSAGAYTETTLPTGTLYGPSRITVDGSGNLYLQDFENNIIQQIFLSRVLRLTPSGTSYNLSTVESSTVDGYQSPTVDGNGNLYFLYEYTDALLGSNVTSMVKLTPAGNSYSSQTLVPGGILSGPSILRLDGNQNLYIDNRINNVTLAKVDVADAPSAAFASSSVGTKSGDSPQAVQVTNIGNAGLVFPASSTATNPTIGPSSFALSNSTTCPQIAVGGVAASINAGSACAYGFNFTPATTGTISGSLVMTDNALNAVNGTQTILLSGTGTTSSGGNVVMALLTVGPNGVLQGAIQAKSSAQSNASSTYNRVWADTSHQTLVQGFVFLQTNSQGQLTCNLYSQANVTAGPAPLYGTLSTSTVNYELAGNVCPNKTFPFTVVKYKWNANVAVQQDTFILQVKDQNGVYLNEYGIAEQLSRLAATPLSATSCSGQAQPSATLTLVNPPSGATGYTWQIAGGNNQVHFLNGQQAIQSTNNSVPINIPSSGAPAFNLTVVASLTYNLAVVSTQDTAVLEYGLTPYKPDPGPVLSITKLQYTNSQDVWLDSPSNPTPVAMAKTAWEWAGGAPASYPSVFISGNSIQAAATFTVSEPPASALPGTKIYGILPNNLGTFVACVDIPAGAASLPSIASTGGTQSSLSFTPSQTFPASTTQHLNPLQVAWKFSPTGQDCSSGTAQCTSAGNTSSEVFVTLAQHSVLGEAVMPMTAVKLAIGSGGATTQTAAFNNTWAQFAGPANVTAWDNNRKLYYYQQGVGFYPECAANSVGLLTQLNASGECGAWRELLLDSLAVNGIQALRTSITAADQSAFLVKDWTYGTPSSPTTSPYYWRETFATTATGGCCEMVPLSRVSGDLTSLPTLYGQNTAPPSEKLFGSHYIIKAPSGLNVGGPYFDPSYGVTYQSNCDFENKAVAGYAVLAAQPTPPTVIMAVRQSTGNCNINFSN